MRNRRMAFSQFHTKLDQILEQQAEILSYLRPGVAEAIEPDGDSGDAGEILEANGSAVGEETPAPRKRK